MRIGKFPAILMTLAILASFFAVMPTISAETTDIEVTFYSPSRDNIVFPRGYELSPTIKVTGKIDGGEVENINADKVEVFIDGVSVGEAAKESPSIEAYMPDYNYKLIPGYRLGKNESYELQVKATVGDTTVESVTRTVKTAKYMKNTVLNVDFEEYTEDDGSDTDKFMKAFKLTENTQKFFATEWGIGNPPTGIVNEGDFDIKENTYVLRKDGATIGTPTGNQDGGLYLDNDVFQITGTHEDALAKSYAIAPNQRLCFEMDVLMTQRARQFAPVSFSNAKNHAGNSTNVAMTLVMLTPSSSGDQWVIALNAPGLNGEGIARRDDVIKYTTNTWYNLRYELDMEQGLFDFYINGERIVSNFEFGIPSIFENGVAGLKIHSRPATNDSYGYYIDNYKISYYSPDTSADTDEFRVLDANLTPAGNSMRGDVSLKNTTATPETAVLLIGLYNENKLVDAKTETINIGIETELLNKTISIPIDPENTYTNAKLFIWDNEQSMMSLWDDVPTHALN